MAEGPTEISKMRVLGVLQRIAVCYAVVSLISVLVLKSQVINSLIIMLILKSYPKAKFPPPPMVGKEVGTRVKMLSFSEPYLQNFRWRSAIKMISHGGYWYRTFEDNFCNF